MPPKKIDAKKNQALDFETSYPCPACRQGALVPITLTEAWGCDRCKQIFERQPDTNTIGRLANPYQRQRTWRWNGQQWVISSKLVKPRATDIVLSALLVCLIWFGVTQLTLPGFLTVGIIVLLLLALVVLFWVVLRR